MLNQRSEHETLRKWSTFSLVLVVAGHLEWGPSVTSSQPSLNTLCHLLQYDLEMQSSLRASCSNSDVSVAFFLSFPQNLIVCRCSSKRFIPLCYKVKKTYHAEARLSHSHCKEWTGDQLRGKDRLLTTLLDQLYRTAVHSHVRQNHTHYLYDGPCTCTWYMANKTAGVITELRTKGLSFHNLKCHTDASGERQSPLHSKMCSGQLHKP